MIYAVLCTPTIIGGRVDEGAHDPRPGGERRHRHEHRGHLGRRHCDCCHRRAGPLHPEGVSLLQVRCVAAVLHANDCDLGGGQFVLVDDVCMPAPMILYLLRPNVCCVGVFDISLAARTSTPTGR